MLQDLVQAHKWFSLVKTQSKELTELAENNRKVAEAKMTPKQIEEAQALAIEWLAKHKQPDQPVTPQLK